MHEPLFRCSSIGKLMTEPRTQKEGPLSAGARTYIRSLVAQDLFGIDFEISSKEIEKGIVMEADAIDMLCRVRGLRLEKNKERRSNDWISGEADIYDESRRRGHDIKCSWSASTFPLTVDDCKDSIYEWQMRGYMMLWDADEWEVNYCLLNTPEEMIRYEPVSMHFFDHIAEHMRITTWTVRRDVELEKSIIEKIKHAREYYSKVVHQFHETHILCSEAFC